MTYYYFLNLFLTLFISLEIYLLGKYLSKANNFFKSNDAVSVMLGATIYFFITFILFFFFKWFNLGINHYVVILVIKEIIQVIFLYFKRHSFKKINWVHIGFTFLAMSIVPLIFNLGLNNIIKMEIQEEVNIFQNWILYKKTVSSLTNIDYVTLSKWTFSAISSLIIYNSISSFVISFSKRKNWFDYLISFILLIFLLITFNFGWSVDSMIGIYLLLFAIQVSSYIITYSRRRYGLIFGILIMNIWFLDSRLFLSIVILGVITFFIYTAMRCPKPSLFGVQILSPILIILSLEIYYWNSFVSFVVMITSIFLYFFIISIGRWEALHKMDIQINKVRLILPTIILLSLMFTSLGIFIGTKNSIKSSILLDDAIFDSFNNKIWNLAQGIIYHLIFLFLCISILYIKITKKQIIKYKIISWISFLFILTVYNPWFHFLILNTTLKNQFIFFRIITFMPLILFLTMSTKKYIYKNKTEKNWNSKLPIYKKDKSKSFE